MPNPPLIDERTHPWWLDWRILSAGLGGLLTGFIIGFRRGGWEGAFVGGFLQCVLGAVWVLLLGKLYDERGRPRGLAWGSSFGGTGLLAGSIMGLHEGGWEGALVGGFVVGVIGTVMGFMASLVALLIGRLTAVLLGLTSLDHPVRRPDIWAWPLACGRCGWRTTPEGPWRVRDCFSPPTCCPVCGEVLHRPATVCPQCRAAHQRLFRLPRGLRQWLHGEDSCAECGCEFDKWGRCVGA